MVALVNWVRPFFLWYLIQSQPTIGSFPRFKFIFFHFEWRLYLILINFLKWKVCFDSVLVWSPTPKNRPICRLLTTICFGCVFDYFVGLVLERLTEWGWAVFWLLGLVSTLIMFQRGWIWMLWTDRGIFRTLFNI